MNKFAAGLAITGILAAGFAGHQAGAEDTIQQVGEAKIGTPASFISVEPYRTYDSRQDPSDTATFNPTLDEDGVPQIPAAVEAVSYNITIFDTEGAGFITMFGCFDQPGNTALANWSEPGQLENSGGIIAPSIEARETVTALLCASVGGSDDAATHFTVDITGYFQ